MRGVLFGGQFLPPFPCERGDAYGTVGVDLDHRSSDHHGAEKEINRPSVAT